MSHESRPTNKKIVAVIGKIKAMTSNDTFKLLNSIVTLTVMLSLLRRAADTALVSRHMTMTSPHPLAQVFTGVVVRASRV